MPTVIAQRVGERVYVVQTDAEHGYILDVERRRAYPEKTLVSIWVRGYWTDVAADTPPLDELLRQVGGNS